jgi:hypothetical protein
MRKNHGWAAFWQKKQYIIAGTLVILAAVGMTVLYSRGQEQERKQLEQEIAAEMDCLRNVVEHVLHIIQQIVSFPTVKICKAKKCRIFMFLCIPFYIKTAFECMLCVLSSAVQNFLFPCVYHVI